MNKNLEKILVAVYYESLKDFPDMSKNIRHTELNMEYELLNESLRRLQELDYIKGARFGTGGLGNKVQLVKLNTMNITHQGIHYVKQNLL